MASKTSNMFPSTNESSSSKSRNIKCFKCLGNGHIVSQFPNKKIMVLRENERISSDSYPNSPTTNEGEVEYKAYAMDGDLLMVRRLLGGQAITKEQDKEKISFILDVSFKRRFVLSLIVGVALMWQARGWTLNST